LADVSKEIGGHYGILPMQVYLSQNCHQRARLLCAEYIRTHQEDFKEFLTVPIEEYLVMLREGKLWGGEVELVALSKLYGRPLVVYNEQDDSVQEQVFPSVEEDEHPTSTEELRDPVSAGDTHDLTPIQSLGNNPHHPT